MKKTKLLENLLSQHEASLSAVDFKKLSDEVDRRMDDAFKSISAVPAGIPRAILVQSYIDEKNTEFLNVATTCSQGCGFCCHLEVEITEDDAERLAEAIWNQKIPYSELRLREQSQRTRLDSLWKKGIVPENRCVLLDASNSCRAYGARPTSCRKHVVVSPVSDCETLGASPVSKIVPLNEIYMSAYINLPDVKFASLSKMLRAALAKIELKHTKAKDLQSKTSVRNRLPSVDL